MIKIKEASKDNQDFINLLLKLDEFQNNLIKERKDWGFSSLDDVNNAIKILLAYDKDNPVASASLTKVDNNTCMLSSVYVDEEYRENKIGKLITSKIINYAKKLDYKKIVLYTWKGSVAAINLYKKLGFNELSILQDSYKDKDKRKIDELTVYMEKTL